MLSSWKGWSGNFIYNINYFNNLDLNNIIVVVFFFASLFCGFCLPRIGPWEVPCSTKTGGTGSLVSGEEIKEKE